MLFSILLVVTHQYVLAPRKSGFSDYLSKEIFRFSPFSSALAVIVETGDSNLSPMKLTIQENNVFVI